MSKTHQKRDDKVTLCGIHLYYQDVDIVELPEEVTCKNCLASGKYAPTELTDVVASDKEANTEPIKSATPTPLTTNEELDTLIAYVRVPEHTFLEAKEAIKMFIDQQTKEARIEGFTLAEQIVDDWKKYRGSDSYKEFYEARLATLTSDKQEK